MKQTFFEERWNMTQLYITDRIWQGWLGLCKGIGGVSSDKKLLNNSINAGRLWGTDLNKLSSTRLVYTMPAYHVAARAKEGKKRHFNVAPGNSDIPANIQMWGNSHLSPNPPLPLLLSHLHKSNISRTPFSKRVTFQRAPTTTALRQKLDLKEKGKIPSDIAYF